MTAYPRVLSEHETLARVCAGASIARYGDGEFKLCRGGQIKSQPASPTLAHRLREVLVNPGPCLVGIPNLHSDTPKAEHWAKYAGYASFLAELEYGSAFISRPDSAPWIDTADYWAQMATLWRHRAVTLVRGSGKSFTKVRLEADGALVTEVIAPKVDAWADYESLLAQIGTPTRALLCVGPTATVLAADLCARGVHAVDLGHAGMFWRRAS